MGSPRQRIASVLDRAKVLSGLLHARQRTRLPVLSVIAYHSIGNPGSGYLYDDDVIDATEDEFRRQLEFITRHFTVIDSDDLCAIMSGSPPPGNSLLITFDDGYRTCVDVALPLLQEFGATATFFIATDYVAKRRLYWWDTIHYLVKSSPRSRIALDYPSALVHDWAGDGPAARRQAITRLLTLVKSEPAMDIDRFLASLASAAGVEWTRAIETRIADELIMTWQDVRTLRDAGMDIQSHTRTHRVLQTLTPDALAEELAGSSADLEREVGAPARVVAYPVGYSIAEQPSIRTAVETAGYKIGFTNASGVNYLWRKPDRYDLRRIAMERGAPMTMFRAALALPPLGYARR